MRTLGKLLVFMLVAFAWGCPKQRPSADPPSGATEAQDHDDKAELEAACYDGDPEACDSLGH